MTALLLPNGKQQFEDINGLPLVGGTVGMYVPTTLVPKATWQDAAQTILNTNPIILDSRGQAVIYGNGVYRQVLKDSLGNLIWDQPTASSPPVVPYILADDYGAKGDGSTDDTAAINLALVAGETQGLPVILLGKTYKVLGTLTWDWSKTTLQGTGTVIDATNAVGAVTLLNPFTSSTDVNNHFTLHGQRPVEGFFFLGNSNVNTTLMACTPITVFGLPYFNGGIVRNCGYTGFGVGLVIGDGMSFQVWENVNCSGEDGRVTGFLVRLVSGATNAGENIRFMNCHIVNALGVVLDEGQPVTDLYFFSPSIDGVTYILTGGSIASPGSAGALASVSMVEGHCESLNQTDYAVWTTAGGMFRWRDFRLVPTHNLRQPLFKSDGGVVNGGIEISPSISGLVTFTGSGIMCDGTGRFVINPTGQANSFTNFNSIGGNLIPDYKFTASPIAANTWVGGVYDNTNHPTGATGSIKVLGGNITTTFKTAAKPGEWYSATAQLKFTTLGAGDTLLLFLIALDVGGNILLTLNAITISSALAAFTAEQLVAQAITPPGTASVALQMAYSASGGGASGWIGTPFLQGG